MVKRPSVLVVDDEEAVLDMIRSALEDHPYHLKISSSGVQALKLLDQVAFNVIITDMMMKPVDGLEVLRRAKDKNSFCEIIMITGFATLDSTLAALRGKVFDFIEKPLNLEQLERSLQNALRKNSLAIDNARLLENLNQQNEQLEHRVEEATKELQERTIKDYLTGLHNYRFFVNALTTEISRSVRYSRPLSLVMMDLDFFKNYNDALGHMVGNQALKAVAQILHSVVRENDVVARYGGEEFAIVLPETSKEEAAPIIRRIQTALRDRYFSYTLPDGNSALLTISAGIAHCPNDGDDFDRLVRSSDAALFQAKKMGRDQLVLAETPTGQEEA